MRPIPGPTPRCWPRARTADSGSSRLPSGLLTRNGWRNTSLAEIARECGISPAGLLHHFESKEQLLHAVLDIRDADDESHADRAGDLIAEIAQVADRFHRSPELVGTFTVLLVENILPDAPLHDRLRRPGIGPRSTLSPSSSGAVSAPAATAPTWMRTSKPPKSSPSSTEWKRHGCSIRRYPSPRSSRSTRRRWLASSHRRSRHEYRGQIPAATLWRTTVAEAVRFAGGWLFDRVMAGWDVTVIVANRDDDRPLKILGATAVDLEVCSNTRDRRCPRRWRSAPTLRVRRACPRWCVEGLGSWPDRSDAVGRTGPANSTTSTPCSTSSAQRRGHSRRRALAAAAVPAASAGLIENFLDRGDVEPAGRRRPRRRRASPPDIDQHLADGLAVGDLA